MAACQHQTRISARQLLCVSANSALKASYARRALHEAGINIGIGGIEENSSLLARRHRKISASVNSGGVIEIANNHIARRRAWRM